MTKRVEDIFLRIIGLRYLGLSSLAEINMRKLKAWGNSKGKGAQRVIL